MEQLYITKIIITGTSKAIVIPTPIMQGMNWKRGDHVIFTFAADDQLIVKKIDEDTIRQLKRNGDIDLEPTIQI